jgi:hypothetical protein
MKRKGLLFLLLLAATGVCVAPILAQVSQPQPISGQYLEARTADVYTGPCFANSEVNLTGREAVLAWRIEKGSWRSVAVDGLAVVAVVRASATLGDLYASPLPAKAVFIVDARANEAQRAALVDFAQAQTGGLLRDVVAIESSPIRFAMDESGHHADATLEAGSLARIATRAIQDADQLCHNEEVYYPPLAANLNHAMPAVATESTYRGNHLGVNWMESGRRGSFVGTFSF